MDVVISGLFLAFFNVAYFWGYYFSICQTATESASSGVLYSVERTASGTYTVKLNGLPNLNTVNQVRGYIPTSRFSETAYVLTRYDFQLLETLGAPLSRSDVNASQHAHPIKQQPQRPVKSASRQVPATASNRFQVDFHSKLYFAKTVFSAKPTFFYQKCTFPKPTCHFWQNFLWI